MQIHAEKQGNALHVYVRGEIDEHSAKTARIQADALARSNAQSERAVFNLVGVSFMDSTGIGFLIGRYKTFRALGIPTYITGARKETDRILQMSGIYSLMPKI